MMSANTLEDFAKKTLPNMIAANCYYDIETFFKEEYILYHQDLISLYFEAQHFNLGFTIKKNGYIDEIYVKFK